MPFSLSVLFSPVMLLDSGPSLWKQILEIIAVVIETRCTALCGIYLYSVKLWHIQFQGSYWIKMSNITDSEMQVLERP